MPNFSDLFGGAGIKSIQRGVIAIGTAGTTFSATISAVNVSKSELRFLGGGYLGSSNSRAELVDIVLSNSTTVTATTITQPSYAGRVSWELTEYL